LGDQSDAAIMIVKQLTLECPGWIARLAISGDDGRRAISQTRTFKRQLFDDHDRGI